MMIISVVILVECWVVCGYLEWLLVDLQMLMIFVKVFIGCLICVQSGFGQLIVVLSVSVVSVIGLVMCQCLVEVVEIGLGVWYVEVQLVWCIVEWLCQDVGLCQVFEQCVGVVGFDQLKQWVSVDWGEVVVCE